MILSILILSVFGLIFGAALSLVSPSARSLQVAAAPNGSDLPARGGSFESRTLARGGSNDERRVAILRCSGRGVKDRYLYNGLRSCKEANSLHGGPKECPTGCIGFGDCVAGCPHGAISLVNGFPAVDEAACRGCGMCVHSCPKDLFAIQPISRFVHVKCRSREMARDRKDSCTAGCMACGSCVEACERGAITIDNDLAYHDYMKCTSCGSCAAACPTTAIVNMRGLRDRKGLLPKKVELPDDHINAAIDDAFAKEYAVATKQGFKIDTLTPIDELFSVSIEDL